MIDSRFYDLLGHLGRGGSYQLYWTPDGEEHTNADGSTWREKVSMWFPVDQVAKVPQPWIDNCNVYFGVHPSRRKGGQYQRAKIEDVQAVNCLFAEFDVPKGFSTKAEALKHIRALSPTPSVLILSGGGYHCYWLFVDAYTIADDACLNRIRALQYAWVEHVGGDVVKDLARVLRVPGTLNRKPDYSPYFPTVQIITFDLSRTITIDEAEAIVGPLVVPSQASTNGTYTGIASDTDVWDLMFSGPYGHDIRSLCSGSLNGHNDDHSAADYDLCRHLAHYCEGDASWIDRMFRQSGLMRDKWNRDDYRDRTISQAISAVGTFFDWDDWRQRQQASAAAAGAVNGAGPHVAGPGPTSNPGPSKKLHYAPSHPTPDDYLQALADLGYTFRMNGCDDSIEVNGIQISDALRAQILVEMYELGYKNGSLLENIYHAHAYKNIYHPIRDYLVGLQWDGQDHIRKVSEYFEDKHQPIQYAHGLEEHVFYAFFKRWCISAVAKVMHSGQFQAQSNMLVLEGGQDVGKSSFVYWLGSPLPKFFIEGPVNPENKDHLRYLCTKWIWEVAELGSTTRKADREALKAFITQVDVTFRVPYGRSAIQKPALASFIGTINNEVGFLSDPTGNRRFWVCGLQTMRWGYSSAIDVNQVWAQAYALFSRGEPWRLTPEERQMRDTIHDAYTMERPYESWLYKYFDVDPNETTWFISSVDIVEELARRGVNDNRTAMQMQLAMTLRALGLEKTRVGGVRGYQGVRIKLGPGGLGIP